jgi:hypothetical protein
VNVTNVANLYGWEFHLDYDPSVLEFTYGGIVVDGLNSPTYTYRDSETTGQVWWEVSTTYLTTSGVSYSSHAIFEMRFKALAIGVSSLNLSDTILSDNNTNPITHTVVNGSVNVQTLDLTVDAVQTLNKHENETWLGSIYANDTYASA